MMFSLRQYQISALNKIDADLQNPDPVLLSAIMGAGKTVIISRLINSYYFQTDRAFLILAHKKELVEQFNKTFKEKTDIPDYDIGICCAGLGQKELKKRIIIGTIQTFVNELDNYEFCSMLVIDEAHRIEIGKGSQYDQVIDGLRNKNANLRILGCTATPYRLGHGYIYGDLCTGKNLFPSCNYTIQYKELVETGYLMPLEGKVSIDSSYQSDIKDININGDYALDEIGSMMSRQVHLESAVEAIKEYCNGYKHICVFCCTIAHSDLLNDLLGDESTVVHSQLSMTERDENLQAWKSGLKRIICSVNILVEGFDFPPLDCLVFARPTLSAGLYLQAVGRVLRISPVKNKAFLLDLTDNTSRFGTDLDNIEIKVPRKVENEIKKIKELEKDCPNCNAVIHTACVECPDCGYQFPEMEYQDAGIPSSLDDVRFGEPEPETWNVTWCEWHRHTKKDKPDSVRIEYHFLEDGIEGQTRQDLILYGWTKIASEWLCFEHGGYATEKAKAWWRKMCNENIPKSTDEALDMLHENGMAEPIQIITKKDGKFKQVVNHIFDECKTNAKPEFIEENKIETIYDDDVPF